MNISDNTEYAKAERSKLLDILCPHLSIRDMLDVFDYLVCSDEEEERQRVVDILIEGRNL